MSALRTLSCAATVLFSPLRPVGSMTKSTAVGRCARLANVSRSISLRSSAGRSSRPLAGRGEYEAHEERVGHESCEWQATHGVSMTWKRRSRAGPPSVMCPMVTPRVVNG